MARDSKHAPASHEDEIGELRSRERMLRTVLQKAETDLTILRASLRAVQAERDAMLASTSWRITMPMRKLKTAWTIFFRDRALFVQLVRKNLRWDHTGAPLATLRVEAPEVAPQSSADPASRRKAELVARLEAELVRRAQAVNAGQSS
jgi:hypothetical protein